MRVLYLTPGVFDKGGISRYGRYQIQALRDLVGDENVRVVSLMSPESGHPALESPFSVDWHGPGNGLPLDEKAAFTSAALRFARRQRPDLIWCGLVNCSGVGWLAARIAGAHVITQVYGHEVWTPRRFRPDISWGLRHSDHLVSDCHFTARYIENKAGSFRGRVAVMWDCVDVERFSPGHPDPLVRARYAIPDPVTGFNILTLGRLSTQAGYKGYERLLELFTRLPPNAHLIYAGGGDLVSCLQERARAMGVGDRVTFTGLVHEADLPDVYRAASVFSMVGDRGLGRGEGIPLTPLEAAACGVPILVGNQDGSREAVEQGVNGFALDPFDLEEIARHLTRLGDDEPLRRTMGQAARARIEREHAYPVFRERMQRFLSSLGREPASNRVPQEETP